MENKRVVWLDALKGFAIFLVVLGHCIERVKTGNSTNQKLVIVLIRFWNRQIFSYMVSI